MPAATDISELFERDPLKFTREGREVEKIIDHLRSARAAFVQGNLKAGSMKPPKEKKEVVPLDLKDLGL